MTDRFLAFFSGFPSYHFTDAVVERLDKELTRRESIVFVSAWPDDFSRNDDDLEGMYELFTERGIYFGNHYVIDNRTEAARAVNLIEDASCVFFMGGHPGYQMTLIHEKGLDKAIRGASCAVLGLSAGSINMAVRSLDTKESPIPYVGMGLADITVKPHFSPDDRDVLSSLLRISAELPIHAMEDESAIFVRGSDVSYVGRIHMVRSGEIHPISLG